MTKKTKTAPLDKKVASRLLDLLSTDDEFRERFQLDPRVALQEAGYVPPEDSLPEALIDCRVTNLASKSMIAEARETILAMLTAGLNHTSPQLDASLSDERRTLK